MNKPPPIKSGDYVKVIKSNVPVQWTDDIIGRICRVKIVYDYVQVDGHYGNDITVIENDSYCLRWTDGEWIPVNFSIYLKEIEDETSKTGR